MPEKKSKTCPDCGSECDREEVDIGVGTQCGPWQCNNCGWKEPSSGIDKLFKSPEEITVLNEKQYAELKEVIQKAVPSIMELKHGCYLKWNYDTWFVNCERCDKEFIFAYSCTGDAHSWPDAAHVTPKTAWSYKYKNFSKEDQKEIEILGRPIRLVDVLLAIEKKYSSDRHYFKMSGCVGISSVLFDVLSIWALKEDNLDNQSEGCKEYLYNILLKGQDLKGKAMHIPK